MSPITITEADLHAYLDEALPQARRDEVKAYLALHPQEAERVHAYRIQKQTLKALFNPVAAEVLPEHLRALATPPAAAVTRRLWLPAWSLRRIAAGLLIAIIGGASGWLAHDRLQPAERMARATPLARQAAVAHVVFSPDVRRPVEVDAEHEEQLVAWLSKRLGTPVHPPRLGTVGFELIGGRLLPGNSGPVAQFMYHNAAGQRLTLYVSTEITANHDTAFQFAQEGAVNVFYWIDGKFGYALSAEINKTELARVATAVYEQLEHQ